MFIFLPNPEYPLGLDSPESTHLVRSTGYTDRQPFSTRLHRIWHIFTHSGPKNSLRLEISSPP